MITPINNQEPNILVVEDDLSLGFLLSEFLEQHDFKVKLCRDGLTGFSSFQKDAFDLTIIDVMMPKMDGFKLASRIREKDEHASFLFLTAKTRREDKLKGFALGAEDYITKPFDEEELLCRLNVILRRTASVSQGEDVPEQFEFGIFSFNPDRQELTYEDQLVRLTQKENQVLQQLCLRKNRILKREDAVREIYGKYDYFLGRSFDVFVSKLRKILAVDPKVSIENVYKVGFILNDQKELM